MKKVQRFGRFGCLEVLSGGSRFIATVVGRVAPNAPHGRAVCPHAAAGRVALVATAAALLALPIHAATVRMASELYVDAALGEVAAAANATNAAAAAILRAEIDAATNTVAASLAGRMDAVAESLDGKVDWDSYTHGLDSLNAADEQLQALLEDTQTDLRFVRDAQDAATEANERQDASISANAAKVADLQAVVSTYTAFVDGSNVVFSITNYLSGAYTLDSAKLRILELRDGAYREVYNSRDEIALHVAAATNSVAGFVAAATNALHSALGGKADKDWGKYTSAGGEAPSNTVYMTAPQIVFAGGMEYERFAVGKGAICVLTTKGAPTYTVGDEGTFHFQDDGGTNYFGYAKSDSYTIGVNTDDISVADSMVTLTYNITMSGVPCIWYKAEIESDAEWEQLNTPDGASVSGATHTVSWETSPAAGTEVCYLNVSGEPQGFFKATVEVAGEAKFMTNMPAEFSGGIYCTDGIHRVRVNYNNGSPVLEVVP